MPVLSGVSFFKCFLLFLCMPVNLSLKFKVIINGIVIKVWYLFGQHFFSISINSCFTVTVSFQTISNTEYKLSIWILFDTVWQSQKYLKSKVFLGYFSHNNVVLTKNQVLKQLRVCWDRGMDAWTWPWKFTFFLPLSRLSGDCVCKPEDKVGEPRYAQIY